MESTGEIEWKKNKRKCDSFEFVFLDRQAALESIVLSLKK